MRKFAVIGLGQYGFQVAVSLAQLGAEVLAIDRDAKTCERVKRFDGVYPLCLDATDESALRATGIEDVDAAVVAIGQHLEVSIVVAALLRKLAVRRIVARAASDLHAQILEQLGVREVHNPERDMGIRNARSIFAPDLHDRMQLSTGHLLAEVDAREPLWGRTLAELELRKRDVTVIAVKKRIADIDELGENTFRVESNLAPTGDVLVEKGDILVVVGPPGPVRDFVDIWQ